MSYLSTWNFGIIIIKKKRLKIYKQITKIKKIKIKKILNTRIHSSMSSNQIYLEELLEDCNFGLDLVSNQVVSAFVIDDLNLEEIESLHELLPKIVEAFESLGLAYDEDRLDQCLLLMSKSAFYQALKRLNEFRNESECLVFLQDEEIWLSATLTTDIDLTKNTVNVLIYQFGISIVFIAHVCSEKFLFFCFLFFFLIFAFRFGEDVEREKRSHSFK